MTPGDPLSSTIFNVVVDTLVRHWVTLMLEIAEERVSHGQEGRHHNAFFYTDDGMVTSLYPQCLQGASSTLVGLFGRVGLRNNVSNTVEMFCRTCHAAGTQSEAVYRTQMTREVSSYQE